MLLANIVKIIVRLTWISLIAPYLYPKKTKKTLRTHKPLLIIIFEAIQFLIKNLIHLLVSGGGGGGGGEGGPPLN